MLMMARTPTAAQFSFPDEPERDDIWDEAREVAGDPWLHTENSRLGGRTPVDVINKEGEKGKALVRDILRSIRYIGSS